MFLSFFAAFLMSDCSFLSFLPSSLQLSVCGGLSGFFGMLVGGGGGVGVGASLCVPGRVFVGGVGVGVGASLCVFGVLGGCVTPWVSVFFPYGKNCRFFFPA